MDIAIEPASPPFDDAVTTALVRHHHRVVTRRLTEGAAVWGVPVPSGREGNFVARDHNNRGQLAADDDRFTALCVAHSYGVMHYSEVLSFLRCYPALLSAGPFAGVDLGCGIGSAIVAFNAVAPSGDGRWLGFDPNPPTLALAREVLGAVLTPCPSLTTALAVEHVHAVRRWADTGRRVVVVASHLFGQLALTGESMASLASLVVALVNTTGHVELVGLEPDRSGVVERGPEFLALLAEDVAITCHVDEVRDLLRLETRSTSPIAPFVGPCRKRVRWHTLRPAFPGRSVRG